MSEGDKQDCQWHGIDLMWLRNEAGLWEDYEEDESMLIDDCDQNPNHPDNLSALVWRSFKHCHLGWFDSKDI
jgi:hypothetical protein